MRELTDIYKWLEDEGIFVFDRQLPFSNERSKAVTTRLSDNRTMGVFLDSGRIETSAEAAAALLHEGGHCATGTTHCIISHFDLIAKHEYKADKWAVQAAVSRDELEAARKAGYREIYELAEYFGLTEEFMRKVLCWYDHGNLDVEYYYPEAS